MAHFYGNLASSGASVTKGGTKATGLVARAASYSGAIVTRLYVDAVGRDCYEVTQERHEGSGISETLARGVIGQSSKGA